MTRAWVIHPDIRNDAARRNADSALSEAVSLADALPGLEVQGAEVVRLSRAMPGKLFGKGKVAELAERMHDNEIELVLVDGPVTPVQQRNLEKAWGVKILDRTGLILEIFSDRAATREGVLQVEMAALSYQRTRLVRAWTHLERQRGGLGFVGGPGETQIEADRRAIDDQLVRLRRQLDKVVKTRSLHRKSRAKVPFPIVALVGYTNAGKSTLFNRLTGADVMAKDMLFATLDPTMRKVELPSGQEVILSDTVGFISNLPTELVAAFRATLEEVLDADLIVHVRDISHGDTEDQAQDVNTILSAIGIADDAPRIEVWNKIDQLDDERADAARVSAGRTDDLFATSAITGEGLDALLAHVSDAVTDPVRQVELSLRHDQGRARAWLYQHCQVMADKPTDEGAILQVEWTAVDQAKFESEFPEFTQPVPDV